MISILQTGLGRYREVTQSNHKELYNLIAEHYPITVHDFYRDGKDPDCPYKGSGSIQLFDLLKAKDKTDDEIVLKIRSDILITKTARLAILEEIKKVVNKESDICFIGIDLEKSYQLPYSEADWLHKVRKVLDYVIVARRSTLDNTVINDHHSKIAHNTGNMVLFLLIKSNMNFRIISTQIYCVRNNFEKLNNYEVYLEWIRWDNKQIKRKFPKTYKWIVNNPEIINSF